MVVYAEVSVIPLSRMDRTGMREEVAVAFDAIRKTRVDNAKLTSHSMQIETKDVDSAPSTAKAAHVALRRIGAARIISSLKIAQWLDRDQTPKDKVMAVERELSSE